MKPLTAKALIADMLAEGWPGDDVAYTRAVRELVEQGDDVLCARLMVRKEIKRINVTEAN